MAGHVVQDTPLGRDTLRRSFAWMLAEIEKLKPGEEGYMMTLRKTPDGFICFRYYAEKVRP